MSKVLKKHLYSAVSRWVNIVLDNKYLDSLVDQISEKEGIIVEKPRTYSIGCWGSLRVDSWTSREGIRSIKGTVFEIPTVCLEDNLALRGFFAHEIVEATRALDKKTMQRLWMRMNKITERANNYIDDYLEHKSGNVFGATLATFTLSLLWWFERYLFKINNFFVDREAKNRGYAQEIDRVRALVGSY